MTRKLGTFERIKRDRMVSAFVGIVILNEKLIVLVHVPDDNGNMQEWGGVVRDMVLRRKVLRYATRYGKVTAEESHIGADVRRYETRLQVRQDVARKIASSVDPQYCD